MEGKGKGWETVKRSLVFLGLMVMMPRLHMQSLNIQKLYSALNQSLASPKHTSESAHANPFFCIPLHSLPPSLPTQSIASHRIIGTPNPHAHTQGHRTDATDVPTASTTRVM